MADKTFATPTEHDVGFTVACKRHKLSMSLLTNVNINVAYNRHTFSKNLNNGVALKKNVAFKRHKVLVPLLADTNYCF